MVPDLTVVSRIAGALVYRIADALSVRGAKRCSNGKDRSCAQISRSSTWWPTKRPSGGMLQQQQQLNQNPTTMPR